MSRKMSGMKKTAVLLTVLALMMSLVTEVFAADSPTQGTTTLNMPVKKPEGVLNPGDDQQLPDDPDTEADVTVKSVIIKKVPTKKATVTVSKYTKEDGTAYNIVIKKGVLKKAKKMKKLKVTGYKVTFGKGAFSNCKKLKIIDLSGVESISISTKAFMGLTKARKRQIKIYLPKNMPKEEYQKLVKKLKKMGILAKNISRK